MDSIMDDQREYIERLERLLNEASTERDRLRTELAHECDLKQGWIDEYVKLRDMGEMPPDEYGKSRQ